jgi:diguanylate cyclase (GGDEF)-like protein
MILLDIDHFKHINDTFGHPAGDFVLRLLVQTCQECLRNVDIFGRLGGEEFGILLPNTGSDGASELARRIRERVENVDFVWDGKSLHLTVSLGVTQLHEKDTEFADLYGRVDKALYAAKEAGRNQVRVLSRQN